MGLNGLKIWGGGIVLGVSTIRSNARAEAKLLRCAGLRVRSVLADAAIQIAFQPIHAVDTGQMTGVEALARFPSDLTRRTDQWFADAASVGLGVELELLCLRRALAVAAQLDPLLDVSVNLSPDALLDRRTAGLLLESEILPVRIIIEITEHDAVADYRSLAAGISHFRRHGVRLAIDDTGSGYSSFAHILALAPDCLKIDRLIIAGLDADPGRRAMVRAIVGFATEMSLCVVAEGVETEAELTAIWHLGVRGVQGYLTGRPTIDQQIWATWTSRQPVQPIFAQLWR